LRLLGFGEMSTRIHTSRIAGSSFDVVSRYSPDGEFQESWCVCQSERWRTVFMSPGGTLLEANAPEEKWAWQIAQWRLAKGVSGPARWVDGAQAAVPAPVVVACLPVGLRPWVGEATQVGLALIRRALKEAEGEGLLRQKSALEAQLEECVRLETIG
jgi:hypothetical protein